MATIPDNSNHYAIFGYEAGASLVGGAAAAARRVAGPFWNALTSEGMDLFTAAVNWATGQSSPTQPPTQLTFAAIALVTLDGVPALGVEKIQVI